MTFTEFFDLHNIHCLFAIFISLINAGILLFIARKFMQIIQISGYKISGYRIWLSDTKAKYISRIAMLCFLSLACVLVTNALFDVYHSEAIYSYLGLIFYIYFAIVFLINLNKVPQKTPLVNTRRMSRFSTLLYLLCFGLTLVIIWLATSYAPFLRFGAIVLTPLLLPVLVPLIHFCLIPLEALIRFRYFNIAKRILKKRTDLIRIGITGSFGKTSVKYILNKMLAEKYNVCISPYSFNTPMGLTKVVRKYLKAENEILIAEMGAKEVGDIKYLCTLIEPQHAIITGIGSQHYQTFGSEDNIIKTKNELVEALPENANIIFNSDSEKAKLLYDNCNLKNKFLVSINSDSDVVANNIKLSTEKSEFDLIYRNEKITCTTKLLGKHNILNILMGASLAVKLGVSLESIKTAVENLEPISHRLEPIEKENLTILDDAYSSNEEGSKMALDVLALYKDTIKICVTPGIVELGEREKQANIEFGKEMASVCDKVIIVNKINEEAIKEGLLTNNFNIENIITVENLEQAKEKLTTIYETDKKYAILFGNDLPDNYT